MVNDSQLPNPDDSPYTGFIDTAISGSVDKNHIPFLKSGLERVIDVYNYYFDERGHIQGNNNMKLSKEANNLSKDAYIFSDTEAGISVINYLEYLSQVILCNRVIDGFSKKKSLSRPELVDIAENIDSFKIELHSKKHDPISTKKTAEVNELINYDLFCTALGHILEVYEKVMVLQNWDKKNYNIIKWNIRVNSEAHEYDPLDYSARRYLRKMKIREDLNSPNHIESVFENFEIACLKDEFRYHFADSIGVLNKHLAHKELSGSTMRDFGSQYNQFSRKAKSEFDVESRRVLRRIASTMGFPKDKIYS